MVFVENPKKSFLCTFSCKQQNFINDETFLFSLIYFFLMPHSLIFFNLTRDDSLLNLEIYKTKNIPFLMIMGDIFWLPIAAV